MLNPIILNRIKDKLTEKDNFQNIYLTEDEIKEKFVSLDVLIKTLLYRLREIDIFRQNEPYTITHFIVKETGLRISFNCHRCYRNIFRYPHYKIYYILEFKLSINENGHYRDIGGYTNITEHWFSSDMFIHKFKNRVIKIIERDKYNIL